jgi:hypothetical protein
MPTAPSSGRFIPAISIPRRGGIWLVAILGALAVVPAVAQQPAPVPVPIPRQAPVPTVTVTPEDPTYVVGGVVVEKTGPDPVQARNAAVADGQRRALRQLVQRIAPQADSARLPPIDDQRLQQLVRGVEFGSERVSPDRYGATLTVAFVPDRVRAWLGEAGITIGETATMTMVVVPLWRTPQGGVSPLEERHAWREAWERTAPQSAAPGLRFVVARGDENDRRLVTPEQIFVGDVGALAKIAERYRANVAVVAVLVGDPNAGTLTAEGMRYDRTTGARNPMLKIDGLGPGGLEDAARRQMAALEEEWKAVSSVKKDTQDALDAMVPIRDLQDWVRVRQRLQGLPGVKRLIVRALETDRASIRIEHYGTADDLQRALAAVGFSLQRDGSRWTLVPR